MFSAASLTLPSEHCYHDFAGWSSLVARWAHNPKVGGSNPPPATILKAAPQTGPPCFLSRVSGKPYFLYILWSVPGKRFYIGISERIVRVSIRYPHDSDASRCAEVARYSCTLGESFPLPALVRERIMIRLLEL
jgi:hypothetical protein